MAKANALLAYAWSFRGYLTDEPTEEELKNFHENLTAARLVLREAKNLPDKCPYWWNVALRIGNAERWDRKDFDSVFQEAIAFEPDCDDYYFQKVQELWFSRADDVQHEWQKYAIAVSDARGGDEGNILYARLLWVMEKHGLLYTKYANPETSFSRYDQGFAALLKAHPDSLLVMNIWARICTIVGSADDMDKRNARAKELFLKIGAHADETVWEDTDTFISWRGGLFNLADYFQLGMQKLGAGDDQGALEDLTKALAMFGKKDDIFSARASAEINLKKYDSAAADLSQAIAINPREGRYYLQRAYLETNTKNWKDVVKSAGKAIELQPDTAGAYVLKARAHFALGDIPAGLNDYEEGFKNNPDKYGFYQLRGTDFYNLQRWDESLRDFQKYLSLAQPEDEKTTEQFYVWLIRARKGETAAASRELKSFLIALKNSPPKTQGNSQSKPDDWHLKIGAFLLDEITEAQLLSAAEDKVESRALNQKNAAYFYAGMKHLIAGDKDGARERFEKNPCFR